MPHFCYPKCQTMKISKGSQCVKSFEFCRKYATILPMHQFYIDKKNIKGDHARITGQDARHLAGVMRLTRGDMVKLADGTGCHHLARIESTSSKRVELTIIKTTHLKAESPAHITIAQGVLKDRKMDTILRQLTELGMAEWLPFFAAKSVPTPTPGKNSARIQRWQRIAQAAMKQCGRSMLPIIHPPFSFDDMIAASSEYDEKILFWENAADPIDLLREKYLRQKKYLLQKKYLRQEKKDCENNIYSGQGGNNSCFENNICGKKNVCCRKNIFIMIGPESGFSDQEALCAMGNGFSSFSLGTRILRAETAAITACALVQNIFGDLGRKVSS